ncbi:replication protein, partial [uncultured marine virus]
LIFCTMSPQGKNACFTLNNYNAEHVAQLLALYPDHVSYIIFGHEEGESGTPHLQGYIQCNSNKRLAGLKKLQGNAHWELARGNAQENITYCSKDGSVEPSGFPESLKKGNGTI